MRFTQRPGISFSLAARSYCVLDDMAIEANTTPCRKAKAAPAADKGKIKRKGKKKGKKTKKADASKSCRVDSKYLFEMPLAISSITCRCIIAVSFVCTGIILF